MEKHIFIQVGSNLGDRKANLEKARFLIERQAGNIISSSSIYETEPWGLISQPHFLNQALQITSNQSPINLLHTLLEIEQTIGRKRLVRWGPRLIDIDLLFYGQEILDSEELQLPHPRIPERLFVLAPLQEIAPTFNHPLYKKSINCLLKESVDQTMVRLYVD